MPAPNTVAELLDLIRKSKLIAPAKLDAYLTTRPGPYHTPAALAYRLQADGLLTHFHTEQLLKGKHRGFFLGKYKVLDRIGLGGMGQVFLAEHVSMRRRAALKVMPPDRTENEFARERFYREARAAGQLDHPNLVRAFDVDQDGNVIFLVMEFVDGVSFQDLVVRHGALDPARAAHYLWQAAAGLGYLAGSGMIHRDIKPANILVDRNGVVKILDLGLVRSETESDELTRGEGVKILGTADYLAPEQALDCSRVDARADIYSLGATGYFLLTGKTPFEGGQVAQKLIAHQVRAVKPPHEVRPGIPPDLSAVLLRMLAKKPDERFQTAAEVQAALEPWAATTPPPPTEQEIPGGHGGRPVGTVDLNPGQARGSSITSGSGIRYHSGGHRLSEVRSGLAATPTPVPWPVDSEPKPKAKPACGPGVELPPALPAEFTHGAPAAGAVKPEPRRDPSQPAAPAAAKAEPVAAAPERPSRLRQRIWMAIAFALTLLVGAWDVAMLAGMEPRLPIGAKPGRPSQAGAIEEADAGARR